MNEKFDLIAQWIGKADHDLGTAKITYLHIPEFLDTVTFHCQQAIEKYLKSYLIYLDKTFKFSHDLIYLLELIIQNDTDFDSYYDTFSEIQGYAVEVRYPNETIYLSKEKVEKAITIAKKIRDLVISKIKITIEYNQIIDT